MATITSLRSLFKGPCDINDLYCASNELKTELGEIFESKTSKSDEAIIKAQTLYFIAVDFIKQFYGTNSESFEKTVKELEVPLNIVEDQIDYLCESKFQQYDDLALAVSQSCRILIEITALNFIGNGRPILKTTALKIVDNLKPIKSKIENHLYSTTETHTRGGQDMRATLIQTLFEIKCIRAAAKEIDYGAGTKKEAGKDLAIDLLEGLLKGVATLSPSELISPLLRAALRIHTELRKKWYQDIWAIRWLDKGEVWNISFLELIAPLRAKFQTNKKLSLYICQKYMEIVRHQPKISEEEQRVDPALKRKVLESYAPSLITFSKETGGRKFWKSFWQVRYCSIIYLGEISESPNYITNDNAEQKGLSKACIMTILFQILKVKEKQFIKDLGARLFVSSTKKHIWKEILNDPGTQERIKKLSQKNSPQYLEKLKGDEQTIRDNIQTTQDTKVKLQEKLNEHEDIGEQSRKIRHWKDQVASLIVEEKRLKESLEELQEVEESFKASDRLFAVINV